MAARQQSALARTSAIGGGLGGSGVGGVQS